jgi:hypothetical protein
LKKQNSIVKTLKSKSGASLIIVLGIMLLLLTVGISTLVAAEANSGLLFKQKEHSQIIILEDSIHQNILFALQPDIAASEDEENLLSTKLARAICEANDSYVVMTANPRGIEDLTVDVSVGGADLKGDGFGKIKLDSITLSFPRYDQVVVITPPIPAVYSPEVRDPDTNALISSRSLAFAREPKTATVNASMIVTVKIDAGDRIITSRAFYEYTGGELSDDPDGDYEGVDTMEVFPMIFTDYGRWELIKYEKADS